MAEHKPIPGRCAACGQPDPAARLTWHSKRLTERMLVHPGRCAAKVILERGKQPAWEFLRTPRIDPDLILI